VKVRKHSVIFFDFEGLTCEEYDLIVSTLREAGHHNLANQLISWEKSN